MINKLELPMNSQVKYTETYARQHPDLSVEQPYSDKRCVCGRCGKDYEGYLLVMSNSVASYSKYLAMNKIYGWYCKECSRH